MTSLSELLANRVFWEVIAGYWVFMAAVGAMPTPVQGGSQMYVFLFRFGHLLSGNVNRAAVSLKVPGAQIEDTAPKVP